MRNESSTLAKNARYIIFNVCLFVILLHFFTTLVKKLHWISADILKELKRDPTNHWTFGGDNHYRSNFLLIVVYYIYI